MMKKYLSDLKVKENCSLNDHCCLLRLTSDTSLPEIFPGQFVNVRVECSAETFLRRPISINYVDRLNNELWLLVQVVGQGTKQLSLTSAGDYINVLFPLGNGFSIPGEVEMPQNILLIGGGVGVAPLLFLGSVLSEIGFMPSFLLGARSKDDILQYDHFQMLGDVYVTTEDGSLGEKGFVTSHSILNNKHFDRIYSCGPKPMMLSVAHFAKTNGIFCEVSLENKMACGLGACLCCVEELNDGHNVCVCSEGPVFNINQLSWLI